MIIKTSRLVNKRASCLSEKLQLLLIKYTLKYIDYLKTELVLCPEPYMEVHLENMLYCAVFKFIVLFAEVCWCYSRDLWMKVRAVPPHTRSGSTV